MTDRKYKILFVCIHNSARSQMAEAFLNALGGDRFIAQSAGLEPGLLNQQVVSVMGEVGIDISANRTKSVRNLIAQGASYDAVITVCDAASAEKCPVFPGQTKRMAWAFADPSGFSGSPSNILSQTREVRDAICRQVKQLIAETADPSFWQDTNLIIK